MTRRRSVRDIHIGCQTYTWEMLGYRWEGSVDDILKTISGAGYSGVEITNTMIGDYYERPQDFKAALQKYSLEFAAFGFVPQHGFTEKQFMNEEIERARRGIDFVSHFAGCRLVLAGGSSEKRDDLEEKFQTMCSLYNSVAEIASKKSVPVDVHAHSHAGSIIETEEEYDRLMSMTDSSLVGWNPDTGHIVRGGVDLLHLLDKHKSRIRHLHFKDVGNDGKWRMLGKGLCDFGAVFSLLEEIDFTGWVVCEEESEEAWNDQAGSISSNRKYIEALGHEQKQSPE
jgi:sugar phosphate isomerase/epimerase